MIIFVRFVSMVWLILNRLDKKKVQNSIEDKKRRLGMQEKHCKPSFLD